MPSAILDSNCKSRFVTLYILLICGDINPNPGPQWKFPCGFRSAVNKIDQFHAMVDSVKPDIIVGTESWLRPDTMNSEIFPSNYIVYRRDRDTSGGGVFIAVIDEILSTHQQHLETSCEMAWAKISVVGCKDLYVCSYYRPKADDRDSLDLLFSSLDRICNSKNCHIWLARDFKFPGINK